MQQRIESESNKQNRLGHHNDPKDDTVEKLTVVADYPIEVDARIVTGTKRELRPLLFEPSLKRSCASVAGLNSSLSLFHKIKNNPEVPKIWKAKLRIKKFLMKSPLR